LPTLAALWNMPPARSSIADATCLMRRAVSGLPLPKSSNFMLSRTMSGMFLSPPNMSAIVLRNKSRTWSFAVLISAVRMNDANVPL